MISSVNVSKCSSVAHFVLSSSDSGDCLSCEERRRSKLINLIYVFDISKGKILLFYFRILLYLLKNGKSGRNLSKKYKYGWYLHDKEIVAVQVNKSYKRSNFSCGINHSGFDKSLSIFYFTIVK